MADGTSAYSVSLSVPHRAAFRSAPTHIPFRAAKEEQPVSADIETRVDDLHKQLREVWRVT
jgi:hypothetical protein